MKYSAPDLEAMIRYQQSCVSTFYNDCHTKYRAQLRSGTVIKTVPREFMSDTEFTEYCRLWTKLVALKSAMDSLCEDVITADDFKFGGTE